MAHKSNPGRYGINHPSWDTGGYPWLEINFVLDGSQAVGWEGKAALGSVPPAWTALEPGCRQARRCPLPWPGQAGLVGTIKATVMNQRAGVDAVDEPVLRVMMLWHSL